MTYNIILIISIILLIPGLIMSFIPNIPNLIYMFAIAIIFAVYDNFFHINSTEILILAIISFLALLIDFISGIVGAKWGGAHWSSILSGLIGLIIGSAFIPIPIFGSLIGMFLGILASEFYLTKDIRIANKAALGSFLGTVAGISIRIIASFVFFILFIIFALSKTAIPIKNTQSILILPNNNISLIIASTTESKTQGLGGRESLPKNTAMLFTFDKPGKYGIWMKDMKFPIDIFWLDNNKRINTIEENISPFTYPNIYTSVGNSSFVLETNANFAKKNNLQVGNVLNLSLK